MVDVFAFEVLEENPGGDEEVHVVEEGVSVDSAEFLDLDDVVAKSLVNGFLKIIVLIFFLEQLDEFLDDACEWWSTYSDNLYTESNRAVFIKNLFFLISARECDKLGVRNASLSLYNLVSGWTRVTCCNSFRAQLHYTSILRQPQSDDHIYHRRLAKARDYNHAIGT